MRVGGTQASSDAPSRLPVSGFPSKPGRLAVDEFRRTYFGNCRAGVGVLLDASKERRKECEAKVFDNMEGVLDRSVSAVGVRSLERQRSSPSANLGEETRGVTCCGQPSLGRSTFQFGIVLTALTASTLAHRDGDNGVLMGSVVIQASSQLQIARKT